jgi:hypothetical protein
VDLKHLLKRGALLTAANWPVVAIQLAAETTFQVLLGVPLIGAAILVAVLLGADFADLLHGGMREIFSTVASALLSEPVALVAFISAFCLTLFGGCALMFVVKGGTMEVMIAANARAGPIEHHALTVDSVRSAAAFSLERFTNGCARLYRSYLTLGVCLMLVYGVSIAAYVAFLVYGYPTAAGRLLTIGLKLVAAPAVLLVAWTTLVNFLYVLVQVAVAVERVGVTDGVRSVARFVRREFRALASLFGVVAALVVAATLASALAWSGVGLIAFVPLVGLAVFPLQLVALVLRGLVFEYLGLTALGAYLTLYEAHRASRDAQVAVSTGASPASARA